MTAVLSSDARATAQPNCPPPEVLSSSLGVALEPCCVQTSPVRSKSQTAPFPPPSSGPPINAESPSADNVTAKPNHTPIPVLFASLAVSFAPCCVHASLDRVNTHAAPAPAAPS